VPVAPTSGAVSYGVPFMVGAGLVYEIIAAACSSPQTTEINADTRSDTLMKWVHVGLGQSAVFIVVASAVDPKHAPAIIAGGTLAAGFMYASYWHAKRAGLSSEAPGTEGQNVFPWAMPKAAS
jgi:hypothetical protein